MKSRTTFILMVLVAAVGLVVVWDHFKGTSTQESAEKEKHILDFKSEEVTRLELARTNQTIIVEKSGDKWDIKQPLAVRADGGAVNSLLSDLEFAQRERTLTENDLKGANLVDFGLDRPSLRVTLQTKKGPMALLVGRITPTKDALYVQLDGQKRISITPKSILDHLNASLESLRSHMAVEFTPAVATRLELKTVDRVIELARTTARTNAEPRWAIVRPLAARADQRKTGELLTALSDLRIQDFVSEDPKDVHTYQLEDPQREVTIWSGDTGKTLLIGRPLTNDPNKIYAKLKSADSIFTVSAGDARKCFAQINELRDAHVIPLSQSDVHGIELLQGADKIVLSSTNNGWNITSPVAIAADDDKVAALLDKLSGLTATQFTADVATDLDKFGLAAPLATVTLLGSGTNVLTQLLIGGLDNSNTIRYVKNGDEPFIYGVETNIAAWLPTGPLSLRTRRLIDLKPEQVSRLTTQKAEGRNALERGPDGKWKLIEPSQGVLNLDALSHLLDALTQLRAAEFIRLGRDDLAEYGLDAPGFTLTAEAGDRMYSLGLGKLIEGGMQYALWSDPPLVFTVEATDLGPITNQFVTGTTAGGNSAARSAIGPGTNAASTATNGAPAVPSLP